MSSNAAAAAAAAAAAGDVEGESALAEEVADATDVASPDAGAVTVEFSQLFGKSVSWTGNPNTKFCEVATYYLDESGTRQPKGQDPAPSIYVFLNGDEKILPAEWSKPLSELGIGNGTKILCLLNLRGDIGSFGIHADSPGVSLLSRDISPPSARALEEVVSSLPRSPFLSITDPAKSAVMADEAYGYSSHPEANLLNVRERNILLSELEAKFKASPLIAFAARDFKLQVSRSNLSTLLGDHAVERLEHFFREKFGLKSASDLSPLDYVLRRCWAHGECINFHRDHARRTMQVPLNDDYEGGDLVFIAPARGLQKEGREEGCLELARPYRPAGSATLHDWTSCHGVTTLASGTRCALFLLQKN